MKELICIILALAALPVSAQEGKTAALKSSHNVVKVSAGPSLVVTNIYMPVYQIQSTTNEILLRGYDKSWGLGGADLSVTFQHVWRPGLGIGVDYVFSKTWLTKDFGYFCQHYIGPNIVYAYRGWRHWGVEVSVGVGYVRYREKSSPDIRGSYWNLAPTAAKSLEQVSTMNALGFKLSTGVEYRFTRSWGIAFELGMFTTKFQENRREMLDDTTDDVIGRINCQLGARYYF